MILSPFVVKKGTETMSKRAAARVEARDLVEEAPDEMARRERVAAMIRDRMAMPVTDLGLQLWQELKEEIDRARLG